MVEGEIITVKGQQQPTMHVLWRYQIQLAASKYKEGVLQEQIRGLRNELHHMSPEYLHKLEADLRHWQRIAIVCGSLLAATLIVLTLRAHA